MATVAAVMPRELGLPEAVPLPGRMDRRIGIVGYGGIARYAHAPAYRAAGWTIIAVADIDAAARKAAEEELGIERVYEDYRDLIEDEQVEIVDLLTQPTLREEVVRAAAAAGKPVISEKPFGSSIQECVRMVEEAEQGGIPLAVHQNYRWRKMSFLAYHAVQRGLIGQPFFVSIEILGTQDVDLKDHPFYSTCDDFLTLQWNNHLVDLMGYWTGREAARTLAWTGRMKGQSFVSDNLLCALTDFGQGLTGQILHHELLRSSLGGVRCRIDGDQGSLVFDFDSSLTVESKVLGRGPVQIEADRSVWTDSFAGSMGDFLLAVDEGREPMVSGRRNLATMRTVLAQAQSARAGGQWVECA